MTWLGMPKKDATNGDMLWRDVCSLRTKDFRMRLLYKTDKVGKRGELKRLSTRRKINQLRFCE